MAPAGEMARLKAECQRLGIPINAKDSAERLRHKLRQRRARPGQDAEDRAPAIVGGDSQAQLTEEQRRDRETARHARIAQDAAEKKVKDAKDLLEQAEKLLDKGLHPVRIAEGFETACKVAMKTLGDVADTVAFDKTKDDKVLVETAMTTSVPKSSTCTSGRWRRLPSTRSCPSRTSTATTSTST